jgi:hypothetical protein
VKTVTSASSVSSTWTRSQVFECACHEGNQGLRNMLRMAREAEKQAE